LGFPDYLPNLYFINCLNYNIYTNKSTNGKRYDLRHEKPLQINGRDITSCQYENAPKSIIMLCKVWK